MSDTAKAPKFPNPTEKCKRLTGARPTPKLKKDRSAQFMPKGAAPDKVIRTPAKLSYWGNNEYGNCVTAEEAAKCACENPEAFIEDDTVIQWASDHGVLNGAMLDEVLDWMAESGFDQDAKKYGDGGKQLIDHADINALKLALSLGPVKVDNVSAALPLDAGNKQGWWVFGRPSGGQSDHCCCLFGYGTAKDCFDALGLPVPSGVDPNKADCFLFFTWSTIGVVDYAWLKGTVSEAWLRQPNTVYDPAPPPPPPPPTPDPSPLCPCLPCLNMETIRKNGIDFVTLLRLLMTILQLIIPILTTHERQLLSKRIALAFKRAEEDEFLTSK